MDVRRSLRSRSMRDRNRRTAVDALADTSRRSARSSWENPLGLREL